MTRTDQEALQDCTHFISFDTRKLEVYDPPFQHGAIKIARGSDDKCLLVESLGYHDNVSITKIWKLQFKNKRKRQGHKRLKRKDPCSSSHQC